MTTVPTKYVVQLCNLGVWRDLHQDTRRQVADILLSIGEFRKVGRNQVWIREAEQAGAKGYILLRGQVSIKRVNHDEIVTQAPVLLGEIGQFNPAGLRTATVSARTAIVVMRFTWDDLWQAVDATLSEPDQTAVRQAVESYAWEHFTEWPD